MSESLTPLPEKKFSSIQEELSYLRQRAEAAERALLEKGEHARTDNAAADVIDAYKTLPVETTHEKGLALGDKELHSLALDLSPEPHDSQMNELLALVQSKGIKNALSVAAKLANPHLDDDFDRVLVQYVKAGYPLPGISQRDPFMKSLRMTLYEITLPERDPDKEEKPLNELISLMEQLYLGMISVGKSGGNEAVHFTIELAVANHSDEFIFYTAVPDSKRSLLEKQVLGVFPEAKVREVKNDYNIFNENGVTVGSTAALTAHGIYPLKLYEAFDYDPLNIVLNSFSKIDRDGEGAAVQFVFRPAEGVEYLSRYKTALKKIEEGMKPKEAIVPDSFLGQLFHTAKEFARSARYNEKKADEEKRPDERAAEFIKAKIGSPIIPVNIRLVASSHNKESAEEILLSLESAFNQFEEAGSNKLNFLRARGPRAEALFREFSYRLFSDQEKLPLSVTELTTMMHLPSSIVRAAPQLKTAKAGTSPPPVGLPENGTLIGVNLHRSVEYKIFMKPEDRLRHFYAVGQTGTGKTTLLKSMIIQDIAAGEGVCFIDPHGNDIEEILANIPRGRYEDLIYFDPSYTPRPMGLNMLEYDSNFPEQKTFVVNELLSIFHKLYGAVPESMGPAFEQYFRNSALLVMDDPESGNTLVDVSRVLSDKRYRDFKLSRCNNPLVAQFWQNAERTSGEQGLANYVQYVTNKFDVFLANDIMRPVVSQEHSSFNFRDIMDGRKILVVNLSKGRLGDVNAHLIGLIIVARILMAALSRVDSIGKDLPPFYLYIDEFQNITTDSISVILSEARKYKLALTVAHQFIAQLDEKIRDAVFGNVGSIASFRVGAEDAEFLEKQFAPVFSARDILNLDNFNAYVKLLVDGRTIKPFNIATMRPPVGKSALVPKLKELSYLKFGRDRRIIEGEIMAKYKFVPVHAKL